MTDLQDLTTRLLDAAKAAGADSADTIAVSGDSLSIEVLNGKLEQAERSEGTEAGLRVFVGQRQATVSSSDLRAEALTDMAERAIAMAKVAPEDPYCGIADPADLADVTSADGLDLADVAEAVPAELQEVALAAEAAAASVSGVSKVQSAGAGWGGTDVWLAASNGFSGGYRRTSWSSSAVAITGEGLEMERDYCGEGRTYRSDLPDASEIGRIAGERTVARKGSRKPVTGTYSVLYDERVSSSLIGHLISAISGTSITRGSSWLSDALGTAVLPDGMSLVTDPKRPRISGSRPFDAEGLPTMKRDVVADGVLQSWTMDLSTARQLGLKSTGNAARGTSSPPGPSMGNLELTQGTASQEDLLRDMGTGLLVTSMIGSTINPISGDYSRGASGFWVENGEIAYPVNECTIAGNLKDMLRRIVPANDARGHLSRVVPSLLVADMTLAGS